MTRLAIALLAILALVLVPAVTEASSATVCLRHTYTIRSFDDHAHIEGTSGPDVVIVYGDHAEVNLNGGDDVACIYGEHAKVTGGAGKDTIKVYQAHATVEGGPDTDTLAVLVAHDKVDGGGGWDQCSATDAKNHVYSCERFTLLTPAGSVP